MVSCQKDTNINSPSVTLPTDEPTTMYGVNLADLTPEQVALLKEIDPEETQAPLVDAVSCGADEYQEVLMQDAAYQKECVKDEKAFQSFLQRQPLAKSRASGCNETIYIPVAIHYQDYKSIYKNQINVPYYQHLLVLKALGQIRTLNAEFQQRNGQPTYDKYKPFFGGMAAGKTCIEFYIPNKNHPTGSGLSNGQYAVTFNQTRRDRSNTWSGYLNIFVGEAFNEEGKKVLGYSPVYGIPNGGGIRIAYNAFGNWDDGGTRPLHLAQYHQFNSRYPYDTGKTLTHEMGHYLGLQHIWGDGCGQDDGIADTPDADVPHYINPEAYGLLWGLLVSCNSLDLWMNFMDYTDDRTMDMFTPNQATRMNNRAKFIQKYYLKSLTELGY